MTQAQHTPGPWFPDHAIDRDFSANLLRDGDWIAVESADGHEAYCAPGNALLIAAAPAMLAALEAGEGYLANHADKGDAAAQGLAAMFRAAIAQARGTPTGEGGHPIPAYRTQWLSTIVRKSWEPRLSAFSTEEALRRVVADNYGQPRGVDVPALDPIRAILAAIDGEG